jgi:hypothetical protein
MAGEPVRATGVQMHWGHSNVGALPPTVSADGGDGDVAKEKKVKTNVKPVDVWHTDSVEYSLICLLSDMTDSDGGELQLLLAANPDEGYAKIAATNGKLEEGTDYVVAKFPNSGFACECCPFAAHARCQLAFVLVLMYIHMHTCARTHTPHSHTHTRTHTHTHKHCRLHPRQ